MLDRRLPRPHRLVFPPLKSPYRTSPVNCASSSWDALTSSTAVWHSKVAVTQRSVERAAMSRAADPRLINEPMEKTIRFHSVGMASNAPSLLDLGNLEVNKHFYAHTVSFCCLWVTLELPVRPTRKPKLRCDGSASTKPNTCHQLWISYIFQNTEHCIKQKQIHRVGLPNLEPTILSCLIQGGSTFVRR